MVNRPAAETQGAAAAFDEMAASENCQARYELIRRWIEATPAEALSLKRREAEPLFRRIGITFAGYTVGGHPQRPPPFAPLPRVLAPPPSPAPAALPPQSAPAPTRF